MLPGVNAFRPETSTVGPAPVEPVMLSSFSRRTDGGKKIRNTILIVRRFAELGRCAAECASKSGREMTVTRKPEIESERREVRRVRQFQQRSSESQFHHVTV